MDGSLRFGVPKLIGVVGVDVGGTFTDFAAIDSTGLVRIWKRPTTPEDPSLAVLNGLRDTRASGALPGPYALSHGTTVATNALLERRGAAAALVTTAGMADVLEIGRQARQELYALAPTRPAPLLSAEQRYEVAERISAQGEVLIPLDADEAARLIERLRAQGVESLAVCLLFSYLNTVHEQIIAEIAAQAGLTVSLSSEIAPEPREYERTSTVTANAFVAPVLTRYLNHLDSASKAEDAVEFRVMQSNGGAMSGAQAGRHAVKTALSGPAGGVIAASRLAVQSEIARAITFDMGGTSTDVALIVDGECPVVTLSSIGGIPLRTPMLDIHTIGAGGGSEAWVDHAGALKVGPRSAGAVPGPVAYGIGEALTVTDANLFLGRIPVDLMLAGAVTLDAGRVSRYFKKLTETLGVSEERAALGIIAIAEAAMARALRHISVERGHELEEFTLIAFGGAGGLHACALADAVGARDVLIPRFPGALSAIGLAVAPVRSEYAVAFPPFRLSGPDAPERWQPLQEVVRILRSKSDSHRQDEPHSQVDLLLDMRYAGQSFELRVPFDPAQPESSMERFHSMHRKRYGYGDSSEPVEAVVVRAVVTRHRSIPDLHFPTAETPGSAGHSSRLQDGVRWEQAACWNRDDLAIGQSFSGPALVLQSDGTTLVPRGWRATLDRFGSLRLAR